MTYESAKVSKGKVVVSLKAKKKKVSKVPVTIKVGSKKVKVTVKVK